MRFGDGDPAGGGFGFPNPLLGLVAFAVVVVTGVLAVAKVSLPQWYWIGLTVGTLIGAVFVHWLIFQSLYVIGALCPYCMVVWAVTIPLLVVVVVHRVSRRCWTAGARWHGCLPMAVVDRHAVVHRGDSDDHGEVLGLLVDCSGEPARAERGSP